MRVTTFRIKQQGYETEYLPFFRKELIAVFLAGYCVNSGVGVLMRVCLRSEQGVYSMLEQQ